MTEVGRLLRYAVPGGVFELLVASWLLLGAFDYPDIASFGPTAPAVAALLIAAAFPLGYLISVVANEIAWLPQRFGSKGRVRGRIRTDRVLEMALHYPPRRRWLEGVRKDLQLCPGDEQARREADEALVEVLLRMAHTGKAYESAVTRVRGLADSMNSLLNSYVAVAIAWFMCTCIYVGTAAFGSDTGDEFRQLLAYGGLSIGSLMLFLSLRWGERRVANITEAFVIGMIRGKWPTDDTA